MIHDSLLQHSRGWSSALVVVPILDAFDPIEQALVHFCIVTLGRSMFVSAPFPFRRFGLSRKLSNTHLVLALQPEAQNGVADACTHNLKQGPKFDEPESRITSI